MAEQPAAGLVAAHPIDLGPERIFKEEEEDAIDAHLTRYIGYPASTVCACDDS